MLLPPIRMVGNLRLVDCRPLTLPRSRYSFPQVGFKVPDSFTTVGVVGSRFGEENTELTASFPRTSLNTMRWDVKLRLTAKVNEDDRCIPGVNGEVFAPFTAEHKDGAITSTGSVTYGTTYDS